MDNPQYEGGAAMPTTEKGIDAVLSEINERHAAREEFEAERGEDD